LCISNSNSKSASKNRPKLAIIILSLLAIAIAILTLVSHLICEQQQANYSATKGLFYIRASDLQRNFTVISAANPCIDWSIYSYTYAVRTDLGLMGVAYDYDCFLDWITLYKENHHPDLTVYFWAHDDGWSFHCAFYVYIPEANGIPLIRYLMWSSDKP
jgi:hypothetical protein